MPFLILFIIYMYLEFTVTRLVGMRLGFGSTMVLMLISAFFGVFLIKHQSAKALQEALNAKLTSNITAGTGDFLKAFAYFVAGVLFIIPGFFSDIIGFLLLIPFVQHLFAGRFQDYRAKHPNAWSKSSFFYSSSTGWQNTNSTADNSASYNQNVGWEQKDDDVVDTTASESPSKRSHNDEVILDCYVNEEKMKQAKDDPSIEYMECNIDSDKDGNKK